MMYYAERQTAEQAYFIGLFSSTAKAQFALQDYHQWLGNERQLLWIGLGDQLRCSTPSGVYAIIPMETDYIVPLDKRL